jgi:hypothetical protein
MNRTTHHVATGTTVAVDTVATVAVPRHDEKPTMRHNTESSNENVVSDQYR